jgi:hypothetical protein
MLFLPCFRLERGSLGLRRTIHLPYSLEAILCAYQFPLPSFLPEPLMSPLTLAVMVGTFISRRLSA